MAEEDTRELLLPNWKGSGTMGLTLDQNEEGVFVKQLVQNSPAAKTGVVREGDQIVGATVYFDNMSSEDIEKLLANVGQHTVGLKLQRKGDRSPQPGVTYSHDVFSLKSPDVVLSGDDEEYKRIYTKKIKPRLKSDETLEPETQTRTITVTRKVTAYTVDVTGSTDSKEIDISSPEYKIKIPRHEITEISKTSVETEEGKTMIKIPGIDVSGKSLQTSGESSVSLPGDSLNVHTTTVRYKGQFAFPEGENDANSQVGKLASAGIHVPDLSISGPKFQSYERKIDVKTSRFGAEHIDFRSPNFMGASEEIGLEVKTPDRDTSTKSAVNIKESQSTTSKIGFQTSSTTVKGLQLDVKAPESLKSGTLNTSVRMPETDINISSTQSQFANVSGNIQTPKIDLHSQDKSGKSVKIALQGENIKMSNFTSVGPKLDSQFKLSQSSQEGLATTGAHVDTTSGFEGKANISKVNVTGPIVNLKGTDVELENSVGKISMPSFKVPKFGFSETNYETTQPELKLQGTNLPEGKSETWGVNVPKLSMPNVRIDTKGPSRRMGTEISGIESEHDLKFGVKRPEVSIGTKGVGIKGSNVSIEGKEGPVEIADVGGLEGGLKMPKFYLPKFTLSESKGGINPSDHQADIVGNLKPPALDITGQFGNVEEGHLAKSSVSVSLPKISEPAMNLNLKGCKGIDISKPKINIMGPTADLDATDMNIGGKVEGLKFKVPPVQLPKSETKLKGPTIVGNLESVSDSIKVPEVEFEAPKINLGSPESKLSMPTFKMPKFGISESNLDGRRVDVDLPKLDVSTIDDKIDVDSSKLNTQSVNISLSKVSVPEVDLNVKGPKFEDAKGQKVDIKTPEVDLQAPDVELHGKVIGPKSKMTTVILPKIPMPDFDINLKGPKVEDVKGPKVDIKAPEVDLPKMRMPDVDLNLKGPKLEGNLNIKTQEVDLESPDIILKGSEGKLKMPKFGFSGQNVEGSEGDISLPTANLDVCGLDVETPEVKLKGPKLEMPSMNFNLPKISKPDVDLSMKGPKIEGDLKGPKIDIKAPEVDFKVPDVEVDDKVKGPKFKMASVSVPKMTMPEYDINLKGSKLEGDIKGPKIDMKGPKVDLNAPEVDTDGKVKGSKLKMPSVNFPKVSMPDVDLNMRGPNWKGGADILLPKAEGEVKGLNFDLKGPEFNADMTGVDVEGPEGKVRIPKFKMPKFGFSGSSVESTGLDVDIPKADLDLSEPELDVSGPDFKVKGSKFKMPSINFNRPKLSKPELTVKGPKIEGDVTIPKVDIKAPEVDIEGPDVNLDGKVKGPKFRMPSANLPEMSMPDFDINLKGPKVEGDVKCPKVEIKAPEVDLEAPDVDLDGKVKGPKFRMPSANFPKMSMPDFDINLKGPKVEGDVKCPKVEIKAPEVDLEAPDVDLDGKVKGPKFRMPSANFPKMSMPDFDINLKGPKVEGDVKCPKVEMKAPEVDLEAPDVNLDGKVKGPKFRMPSANFPKMSMPDFDINLKGPKVEGDVKCPKVEMKAPEVDLEAPDVNLDGKVKGPKFRMPSANFPKMSMPDFDINLKGPKVEGDVKCPKVEMKAPEVDLEAPDVNLDGKVKGPKFRMPSANFPKMSMPDFNINLKGPKVEGDVKCPKVEIKAPEVDLEAPDVDLDGKVKGPKFRMPSANFPKMSMPDFDINLKGPKVEGDVKCPKVEIKAPEVDLEAPDVDLDGKVKGPKFRMPSANFPKMSMPDFDINLKGPKVEGDVKCPKVEMKAPEVDLEAPDVNLDGKVKGPKFRMPSANLPNMSMPDVDLNLKGPNWKGKTDYEFPKVEGGVKGPEIDIGMPDIDSPEGKLKMPKFKMPKFGFSGPHVEGSGDIDLDISLPKMSMPDVDMNIKGPKWRGREADISTPNLEVDLKGPAVDVKAPAVDIKGPEGKLKAPKIKMPKISVPDIDLNLKGPKIKAGGDIELGDAEIKLPKLEGDLKGPDFDLEVPIGNVELSEGKLKMPTFKMPKFGFSGPSAEGSGVDVDISGPKMNVKTPEVGVEIPEGKVKSPNVKVPSVNLNLQHVSMPDTDLHLKGPKLKGGIDGPDANIEADLKGPKIEIKGPELQVPSSSLSAELPEGKVKGSKFKLPSWGFSKPSISIPDVDLNLKGSKVKGDLDITAKGGSLKGPELGVGLPEVDIDVPDAKVKKSKFRLPKFNFSGSKAASADIKVPKPDVEVSGPDVDIPNLEAKGKAQKFKMPSLNITSPKVSVPDVELNLKEPKFEGDLKGPKIDIRSPDVEAAPDIDLDGKIKGPKFKMSSMQFPKVSMPDVDLNLKGPKIEGDLKGPNIDMKGPELDIEGPDIELETPDVNLKGSEGKFKMPKFKMPKFGMSGPKVEGLNVDVSLPKGNVDVSGPSVDIKPPEIDIEGPEGKLKGPHLKMPKMPSMNIHAPKLSMPDFDLNLKGPKVEGDLKGPKVDIKCPEVNLDAPDIDVDGKVKGPKFGLPSMQFPKMSMPNVDLNLKGPKIEGDLKGPNIDIKGPELNVEGPDVELETPDINLRGSEGKFKMPKFNMPKFGMSGPKVEGLDVDFNLPKGNVDISGPSVDIKPPEIDIEGTEGKLKGPHFKMPKMPSMNIHAPKLSMPDFDLNLKGPKVEGDLKGPKVDIECPEVHLDAPDIDVDGKVKGPKIGLPSMQFPKMSMPNVDLNLKGPKIEGDLKGPNIDIKGPELNVEGPDVELETPDINLRGSEGKFKMPKFNMPKFGMSGPKVEGLDVDFNLPKGNVDISGPSVDIKPPEIDIEGPEGKLKGPHFKMPKMPSMNIHAPKLSMPDFDLNLKGPKVEGDLKGPKVDIKCPEVHLDAPDIDVDGKVKGPKFGLPSMQFPKMSMPDVDLNLKGPKIEGDLKGPNIDIKGPELNVEGPDVELETPDINLRGSDGKFKMPKFNMPKFGMSGPKVEGLDVDFNLPKGNVDISGPSVDIKPPEIDIEGPEGKLKGPHLKMPKMPSMNIHAPKLSMPDFDLNLKGPKVEGDLKGPKVDIKCPEVHLDAPDIDVDGKVKGPKFGLPSMQFPKMSMPDVDLNLKGPKIEGDLKGPNIDIKGPELDIEGPDIELETPDVNLKGSEGKFKMPKFKMPKFGMSGPKVEGLDVDFNLPKGNVDISGPSVDIKPPEIDIEGPEGKLKGPHLKMPKMPSMNIHAPKLSMPDFDLNLKGPKVEGDLKGPKVDIKCPEVNLDAPDIDVDGKVKGPKFGLPSMQFPKMSMPNVDFNLKGPKIEGDLKGPNIDIKGPDLNVEGPDVELETPDINLRGSEGKFKMPKFNMPKFGMSGPKVEGLDVDFNLPKGNVDISGPSVDIKPPEIDIEGPEGKLKGPHFKMPKMPSMNIHGPKLSMPDFDLNLKGPKVEGDLKGPKVDIKCPEVHLDAPDIDVDGKVKGPKFGLPSMQFPKMSMPNVDLNLKGPKIEGDLKGPNIDIKGPELNVEGPDVDLETPDIKLRGSEGKFKMPKFNMPKFGMSGPKVEGLNVDVSLPKGNVDISGPSVDIKPPEIDIEGPEGKLKGPHLKMPKMPSMNIHAPKLSMPDFDLNLKGPKVEGDLKGPKGDIKCPEVHLDAPDIDVDGKVKGPKFGLPSMQFPKMSMPDVDFNLKGPKIEGDLKGPNIDIKGPKLDIEGPDIELETPDVNLKGSEGKFKMPKFKMPKFGMSGPKVEGLDVDLNLPKGNVDISGPRVDIKPPGIDIEGPEGKLKGPHLKMPKMPSMNIHAPKLSMPDFDLNLKGPKVEGDLKGPKVDIKCPEVNLDAPDIDVDGKVKGPKIGLPSMQFPKMSMPNVDLNLKGPKIEGDFKGPNIDIKGPELNVEGPDVELETPDINLRGSEGKFKMPKFNMPKFGMSGPKVEGLDVDLNLPKGNVDISGPSVDIKPPEIDIEGPEGKLKGPHFKMPKMPSMNIHAPKLSMPDFDLNLKGPKVEGDLKGPKVDIKCPEVHLDAPDIDVDGKVKGPKFGLPSMQFPKMSMPNVDLNLKGPKIEGDLKGPNIDIKGPELNVEGPDVDLETPDINLRGSEGKFKMPKFNMPKFGMSGPKVEGLDVDLNLPKGNVDISGPSVDIKPPEIDIEGPEGKLKGPHFKMPKMPSMNIHAPKLSMPDFDLNLKGPKVEGDLKGPKADIKCPEVHLDAPDIDVDGKVKGPKFGLPSMQFPKMSMPDVDFNLKGPKIEGDLKSPNIDIKGPKLDIEGPDIELESPDVNLKGSEGKFKMPKFKMPKFGMSGPKVEGLDVDLNLPKGNVDISGPRVDIKPPGIDIEGPEGKLKGPHLKMPKMPSMNIHAPKLSMPDFDLNLKGPKVEGDLKGPKGDIKCPEVHLDAPDIDVDGKVKGPKFGLPSMQFPKMSMPDVDFNLKGPKIEGDLKGPNIDIKGPELNVEGPDVELETPDINLRGSEGKFKMPKFNMPKFGMSGPKVEGLDVDLNLPKGNVDISGPSVDINTPEIDIEGPEGKLKGPHFKMPKMPSMNIHAPKLSMPDFDLNLKGPKVEGNLKGPKGDIKCPEVHLDAPDIDVDGKVKGPKFGLPSMQFPKMSMPDVDFNLKGPKIEGDLKGPNIDIKGPELDIEGPDIELETPDVNLKGSEGKFKMPKFKMPKFGMSGPKVEGLDVDLNLPKGNVDISGPSVDIKPPEIDIEGPEGKLKGPHLKMPKMPSMNIHAPKLSMPDFDLNLKGPKVEGDFKGPKGDIKCPEVHLDAPDIDVDGKVKGPKFGLPSMQFPKMSMPDVDFNLKGPKIEGDLKGPNIDIKGPELDIEGPDIELETPDVNLKGSEGKFKMPKFKMPKFGMSGPKVEGLNVDVSLPKGNVDVSGPSVDIKPPEIDIEGPEGKLKGPHLKMPKMPSMNIHAPKLSMPDFDLTLKGPKVEGDLKGPKGDIKCPEVHLDAPDIDVDGKVKGPHFGLPSMQFPKMSMPDVDFNLKGPKIEGDLKGPNIDIKGPELDIEGPDIELETPDVNLKGSEGKFKMPKFKMPKFGMSGPKVEGLDVDLNLPKGNVDISGPSVDINPPEIDIEGPEGKLKGPHLKMPKMLSMNIHAPKLSMPDFDLTLKGPKVEGDLKGPKGDIKCPEVHLDAPDIDVDGKVKGPHFGLPSMQFPKMSMPDVDFNLKGPKIEGDLKGPNIDIKGPELDIEGPDIELETPDVNLKGSEGKFKMPKFNMPKFGMSGPKVEGLNVDVSLPKGNVDVSGPSVDIKSPEIDIEGPEGKLKGPHLKMPKMPSMNIHAPKLSMPDFDLNLKGPKVEGDLKGPKVNIKGPEIDLDVPEIDVDGKVKGPNLEGDLKVPNINIKGPKLDAEAPDVDLQIPDVNLKGSEGKLKMPKFKLPKFDISGPKGRLDVDVSPPKGHVAISGDLALSSPKIETALPEVEFEAPDGKIKGSKFKKPSLNLPDVSMPEISLKGPKIKGDVDLSGPKLEGDVSLKNPNLKGDFYVTGPQLGDLKSSEIDVDIDLPEGNLKIPKAKKPKFGFGIKSPKAEVKSPSVDVSVPDVDFDSEIPDVSVSGKGKKGKFKMPKIHMSGPKIKGKKGGFDVSTPNMDNDLNLNAPDVDLNLPGGDLDVKTEIGLKAHKTRKPLFGKLHFPDVEFDIKSPKLKGDGSLQSPKADIKTPDLDIGGGVKMPEADLTTSGVSIEGPDIKMKKNKFKLPGFGMSGPKVEVPDADLLLSKGSVDLSGPKIYVAAPNLDVKTGAMSSNSKLPSLSADMSAPKISVPDIDLNLQGPNVKADKVGSVDLNPPNIDTSGVSGKFNVPEFGISGLPRGGADVNFDTTFKTAKLDSSFQGPSITTSATDITFPKVTGSNLGISLREPKIEGNFGSSPGVDLPSVNVKGIGIQAGLSGQQLQLQGPQVRLPKGDFSVSKPEADISGKDVALDINIKGTSFQTSPGSKFSAPGINVNGQGIDLKGDLLGGVGYFKGADRLRIEGTQVEGDLIGHKVEGGLNVTPIDMNLESSTGKITFPRLLMPKFSASGLELSGREVGVDVDFPSSDVKFVKSGQADVDLEESDIKVKKSKIKMPKLNFRSKGKGDTSLPDVSMSGSKGDLQSSKVTLGSAEGGLGSANLEVEKPAKYEFSLFTSKKTRHRSSSLSEEKDESTHSSPSGTLEAGGSLAVEGGKKKGKHSKIKFGTFGGLGSKSKGSYEVTLSDDENIQGSGASLSSRKSRVSSSSSNDSATKAGVRLPKVELTVAKKKE
ncbi:neuroblast differentiation-associated protein AHNAK isoform X2 [Bufo bufo]|uniref:neuroblast differentiation-associated protein AHNAK isoform X2 n=1 Tax=Bufo bufo TaxID=8384 RepID=UPI001ABECD43|nr:neuroblast differentiation-associated protein AHNAK isoform X2 [Bufo bufo]